MRQIGVVVETFAGKAKVSTQRHTACSGCGKCDGALHKLEPVRDLAVIVDNPVAAKEGQVVQLRIAAKSVLWAAFLAYIFPLINLFVGYGVGQWQASYWGLGNSAEAIGILFAGLFFSATFLGLRRLEGRFSNTKHFQTVISEILEE